MSDAIDSIIARIEARVRELEVELAEVRAERDRLRDRVTELTGRTIVDEVLARNGPRLDDDEWWRLTSDVG